MYCSTWFTLYSKSQCTPVHGLHYSVKSMYSSTWFTTFSKIQCTAAHGLQYSTNINVLKHMVYFIQQNSMYSKICYKCTSSGVSKWLKVSELIYDKTGKSVV